MDSVLKTQGLIRPFYRFNVKKSIFIRQKNICLKKYRLTHSYNEVYKQLVTSLGSDQGVLFGFNAIPKEVSRIQ